MPQTISDEEIRAAERVLFGQEGVFDEKEQIPFIKNLETIDLQAVPGSGKTTALLGKLLILSKHQPFADDSGILVLSHTNASVGQIDERIGSACPHLFTYPNFVGTIQSFVDTYLAIPYFELIFGFRPDFIDADTYKKRIEKLFSSYFSPPGYSRQQTKNVWSYLFAHEGLVSSYRFGHDASGNLILVNKLNGKELPLDKPKRKNQKNYTNFDAEEKKNIKQWLIDFKRLFWQANRVIHYDDAYYFADSYLDEYPQIKPILRKRFKCVFVDEMQDMDIHQVTLLDKVFYDGIEPHQTFQRIGDKNQAIFSYDVKLDEVWKDRPRVLTLGRSMRLSKAVAHMVQPFALQPVLLEGDNKTANQKTIESRIILYSDATVDKVIFRFAQIIGDCQRKNLIPRDEKQLFKAIGWRRYSDDVKKTIVKTYYPAFNSARRKPSFECDCFEDHLLGIDKRAFSSKVFIDNFTDAMLKVLNIENIRENEIPYSKTRLRQHLQDFHKEFLPEYKVLLFKACAEYIKDDLPEVKKLATVVAEMLVQKLGNKTVLSDASLAFLHQQTALIAAGIETQDTENVYEGEGLRIHVGTVHSVKGETHTGTLYLESYYYDKFESESVMDQLIGNQIPMNAGVRTRQSSKVVYVGFSRPTHLLCLAIHSDRIRGSETALEENGWVIDDSLIASGC